VVRDADEGGIAERVRSARHRAGLSREALAFHSGVSWSAIAQVESGRRTNLRPATLAALARALGVTIDYLVTGAPPHPAMFEHRVLLFESDDQFLAGAVPFLSGVPDRSEAAMAILTQGKIRLLRPHLGADAAEVAFADRRHGYRSPVTALSGFREFAEAAIMGGATWVRILVEPAWSEAAAVARLWSRYEALANLVFGHSPVSLLCLYDAQRPGASMVEQIHATHSQPPVAQDAASPSAG
jgi:transcriptional regulator with XRE-family HTH domain